MTFVIEVAHPAGVMPAEAGTQDTEQLRRGCVERGPQAVVPARVREQVEMCMGPGRFPLARKRARGAGMTSVASAAIHHERGALQRILSPHPRRMPKVRRRCLRRDVDGPIRRLTWQRPAPGRRVRMARDPGGLLRPLPPRRQQWRLCAVTALRAQGVNVDVRATGRGGKPKHRSRTQIAVTRVPQGSPGTRAGSQGARRGSQGGSTDASRAGWYRPQGCR